MRISVIGDTALPAGPDSHTTTRTAGSRVLKMYFETSTTEIHTPWKQLFSQQLALNFSPQSPTSCAIRWRQSKQPFAFWTATRPLRSAVSKRER